MSEKLTPWEVEPAYQQWCRKDEMDRLAIVVFPEGRGGSRCWAWMLPVNIARREGLPMQYLGSIGADKDLETAKTQADEAARAMGYEF